MPAHALAQAPQTWRRCHPTQEQPLRRRQTLTSRIRRQIGQPPAAASTHRPPNARGKASKRQEGGPPPRPDAPARGPSISPGARQRRHHGSSRRQRNTIERRARARRSLQMAGRGGGGAPPRPDALVRAPGRSPGIRRRRHLDSRRWRRSPGGHRRRARRDTAQEGEPPSTAGSCHRTMRCPAAAARRVDLVRRPHPATARKGRRKEGGLGGGSI